MVTVVELVMVLVDAVTESVLVTVIVFVDEAVVRVPVDSVVEELIVE
jgi:hypothetical protein